MAKTEKGHGNWVNDASYTRIRFFQKR